LTVAGTLLRGARERMSLAFDQLRTRGFSRV